LIASRSPVLVAEFLNGERHWQSLNNYSCSEVGFLFFNIIETDLFRFLLYYISKTVKEQDGLAVNGV
jgi:hypothetical protein